MRNVGGVSIEPFATGLLRVGDLNDLYWEASGNPRGKPALYLHGGPGSGIANGYRHYFDPNQFFIVSFDQRGCGRSRPMATDPTADLSTNTTQALVADIETLRAHLDIDCWLIAGVSWGTTLALAYAEAHPEKVTEIVLMAVATTTQREVEWITEQVRRLFPLEWEDFAHAVQPSPGQRLIDAYYERITDPDPNVRGRTAKAWCVWEDVYVSFDPNCSPSTRFLDPQFRMVFATLVIHYWKHAGFLSENDILANVRRIAHIPGVMIHGRRDVSSPLETARDLHKAWPRSELIVVEGDGHGGDTMANEFARAIARFDHS